MPRSGRLRLAAAKEATDLRQQASNTADDDLADAQALVEAAADKAQVQKKKAVLSQETSNFEVEANHVREAHIATSSQTSLDTSPQAQMIPTAPPLHLVEDPVAPAAASPARTQRALGGIIPVATWYPQQFMPSCFGGSNGGGSAARSTRDLTNSKRRRKLKPQQ